MIITKHAYKRARQRLGLNRKAFKRMVDNNNIPEHIELVIFNDVIITVKNLLTRNRGTRMKCDKYKRLEVMK